MARCPGCAPIHKLKVWKINGRWYVRCLACFDWAPPPGADAKFGRRTRELAQRIGELHQKEMKA